MRDLSGPSAFFRPIGRLSGPMAKFRARGQLSCSTKPNELTPLKETGSQSVKLTSCMSRTSSSLITFHIRGLSHRLRGGLQTNSNYQSMKPQFANTVNNARMTKGNFRRTIPQKLVVRERFII